MTRYVKIYYENTNNGQINNIKVPLPDNCLGIIKVMAVEELQEGKEIVLFPMGNK